MQRTAGRSPRGGEVLRPRPPALKPRPPAPRPRPRSRPLRKAPPPRPAPPRGFSLPVDEPVRAGTRPSPPRQRPSRIVHLCNLVRPFTLGQLKELLGRTGRLRHDDFWIDRIKSHCYVTYESVEEAVATRNALHGVKWPQSNPKVLAADFATQDELDLHRGLPPSSLPSLPCEATPPPLSSAPSAAPPGGGGVSPGGSAPRGAGQWAEREREQERRERARGEREWDRDKATPTAGHAPRRSPAPRGRGNAPPAPTHAPIKSKPGERGRGAREGRPDKKEKPPEEPPAKLLDDLFRKTKAAPCIYWLPLTDTQFIQKQAERAARARERERRRKEQEEAELRQRGGGASANPAPSTPQPARDKRGGGAPPRQAPPQATPPPPPSSSSSSHRRERRSRSPPLRDRGGRR